MRKILILLFLFLAGCGYSGNGTKDNPIKARAVIVESNDGSRYHCQGIDSRTHSGYMVISVFDCQKIKD